MNSPRDAALWTRNRAGFTLVELAVVMGILGLLAAIIIPAVQQARAASRRIECVNRLKQIGLICHNYVSTHKHYPSHGSEVYSTIRKEMSHRHPEMFNCPSDAAPGERQHSSRSFLFNSGTYHRSGDDWRNGYLLMFRPRRPEEFTDGTSQTAAASERLRAELLPLSDQAEAHPKRYLWWTEEVANRGAGDALQFIENCRTRRTSVTPPIQFAPTSIGMGYDHMLTPNSFGCRNGPFETANYDDVLVPPSSLHAGGVNVLFVDGHVQFVADGIDWEVWQAVGTINGNESVGGENF